MCYIVYIFRKLIEAHYSRGSMVKSFIKIAVFILFFIAFVFPQSVAAKEEIDISVQYGIDGKVQIGKGFPMEITLTNKGEDLSGDLVIYSNPNYRSEGNIVVPIELPTGEEKVVNVSIPGQVENYYSNPQSSKNSLIRFYKGGWKDGEEIKGAMGKKVNPSFFPENRLVLGVLSDSPDSLNYLKLSKYNAESIELITLKEDDIPNDATGLEMFDVLLINDFNLSTVSTEKQHALKNWVRSGGHLMLGSTPGLSQQLGELQNLSLLHIDDQTSFDDLKFFATAENENNPSFSQVDIMTGEVSEHTKVVYADHSLPMVMNKSFGLGEVTQFSFNVGSETLATWELYPAWWEDILQKTVDKFTNGQQYMMEELSDQFGNIVNSFPSSFLPVTALIVLFSVYLILLIPGLYFLLKRLDKRENSWWIIPSVAIIVSVVIFLVGAKNRIAGSQTSDVSILSIDDAGIASGYGAVSILTNSGGEYPLNISPRGFNPFPLTTDYNYDELNLNHAMVEKGQEHTKITFNNVEYWSIRSAIGAIPSIDTGKLVADLKVDNQKLVGTINSALSMDIEEAFLLSGSNAYSLGEIKAGAPTEVSVNTEKSDIPLSAPRSDAANSIYQGAASGMYGQSAPDNKESLDEWKKQELLRMMLAYEIHQQNLNQPLIVGFSTDSIISIEMDKKQSNSGSQTLITQAVDITSSFEGDFTLTEEKLQTAISILEGVNADIIHNGLPEGENLLVVEPGKYQITYQLPEQMKINNVSIHKLQVKLSQEDTAFSIFNVEKGEFLPLEDRSMVFEENAHEFLAEDGSIVLSFEKSGSSNPEVRVPAVSLEGEYKK